MEKQKLTETENREKITDPFTKILEKETHK